MNVRPSSRFATGHSSSSIIDIDIAAERDAGVPLRNSFTILSLSPLRKHTRTVSNERQQQQQQQQIKFEDETHSHVMFAHTISRRCVSTKNTIEFINIQTFEHAILRANSCPQASTTNG
jgi:hypothetical protein